MRVIPPISITDSKLNASTVPEAVAATYAGGTTYAAGALAGAASTYGAAQAVWRSKQAGNIGHAQVEGDWWEDAGIVYPVFASGSSCGVGGIVTDLASHDLYEALATPTTGIALTDVATWKYIGKTNRWRVFDYTRNNKTLVPLTLTITFTPGKRINSLAISGMTANAFDLSISSVIGGGVIYEQSGSLNTRNTLTWSDYAFGEFTTKPSLVFFDIPPYSDCVVTLTLTATAGNVEVGAVGVGSFIYMGDAQLRSASDVLNFSTIDRDIDGNAILTPRRNVPKIILDVICAKSTVDRVIEVRRDLNAAPAFWYGLEDTSHSYFESLSMLGIYKSFTINDEWPGQAFLTLELEEV